MSAHRYWRWRLLYGQGGQSTQIVEAEMRTSVGGADVCSGGTASASTTYSGSYVAANAFDNSTSTSWASANAGDQWLKYDFGAGVTRDIVEYSIRIKTTGTEDAPAAWYFQWSDDDSTWTTVDSRTGITWTVGETKVFALSADPFRQNASESVNTTTSCEMVITGANVSDVVFSPSIAADYSFAHGYSENLTLADALSGFVSSSFLLSDSASYQDVLSSIASMILSSGVDLADGLEEATTSVLLISEILSAADSALASASIASDLMSTLVAQDVYQHMASLSHSETVALSSTLEEAIQLQLSGAESLRLSDALQHSLILVFSESEALSDQISSPVSILSSLTDGFAFIAKLPIDGVEYSAYVMNTDTTAISEYANFQFNSIVNHEGRVYGISGVGLYELKGDSDDGANIDAWVATGDLDFGTSREKNCPRAYLYITQADQMILKTITSRHGARSETYYEIAARDATDDDGLRRVPLGRGVRGVWWRYEIHNVNGGDFNLQGAEVLPVVLSRRG